MIRTYKLAAIRSALSRRERWPFHLSLLLFAAYFARLAFRATFVFPARTDFRYFWVAGQVWAQGASPYSSVFAQVKTALVGNSISGWWLYPPTWYAICRLFAVMPLDSASKIWSALVLLSLLGGVIGWRGYRAAGGAFAPVRSMLVLLATVASVPALRTILYGQTSGFVFLGANLLLYGALRRNTLCTVIGAYLVMLKPMLGIPICTAAILMPGMVRPVVLAAAITVVSMLPAFQTDTPAGMLQGINRNMADYASAWYNLPASLTGFFHILDKFGVGRPSSALMLAAAIVPVLIAFACLVRRNAAAQDRVIALFLVGVSSALFFTLPHRYDLLCAYALAMPVWHLRSWLAVGLCVLPAIALRTMNMDYLTLAAAITWGSAMATAAFPQHYIAKAALPNLGSTAADRQRPPAIAGTHR